MNPKEQPRRWWTGSAGFGTATLAWSLLALITACLIYGPYHADELHQTWAFALAKMGHHNVNELPWEFRDQIRPWLQPGLYVAVFGPLADALGFHQMWFSRGAHLLHWAIVTAAVWELRVFVPLYRAAEDSDSKPRRFWILAALLSTWCVPNLMVRTSSEATTSVCLVLSLAWLQRGHSSASGTRWIFLAGLSAGLSFWFRFQTALFFVGFFPFWFLVLPKAQAKAFLGPAAGGLIVSMLLGLVVDRWGYGEWVLSPWRYFNENIVHNRASSFGESPWYYYLLIIPGFGLNPLLWLWVGLGSLRIWRLSRSARHETEPRRNGNYSVLVAAAMGTLLFLLVHSAIAHKEPRFVVPIAVPLALLALGIGIPTDSVGWARCITSPGYCKTLVGLNLLVFLGFLLTCSVRGRRGADAFFWSHPRPSQVITSLPNFGAYDTNLGHRHNPAPDFQAGFAIPRETQLIGAPADRYTEACQRFPEAVVLSSSRDTPPAKLDLLLAIPDAKLLYRYPKWESIIPSLPTKPWHFKAARCRDFVASTQGRAPGPPVTNESPSR